MGLKIDVDTYRGTREGVPRLVSQLQRHGAGATFLFSLGPDHTGRAIRRAFRPGFASKVTRTSVLKHYGLKTLLYGTVLPGPDIGRRCARELRAVRDAGFEVGIHCWDHVRWQDGVTAADEDWTRRELERACARFEQIFGERPTIHGAAGWQTNVHALRLAERMGITLASDTRGRSPFVPVWNAEPFACPQLPTTLPTLDELIGRDGVNEANVAERILALSATTQGDHVFTLHAELEGGLWQPAFEALLEGWHARGDELVSLGTLGRSFDQKALPRHSIVGGSLPGRSGELATQGPEFLA